MHNHLSKIFYFTNSLKDNRIKFNNKKISIIYRNYKEIINPLMLIKARNFYKKNNVKFYIANNIKLALRLGLDGVYLPSFNKSNQINYFTKRKKFEILGSAHNLKEIKQKERQNVNLIFLAPIFKTVKSNKFLGIYRYILLSKLTKKNTIVLGGINKKNFNKLNLINCNGFASISYIKNSNE